MEYYLDVKITDDELEKMMSEADNNDDCSIDYNEFEKIMMGFWRLFLKLPYLSFVLECKLIFLI